METRRDEAATNGVSLLEYAKLVLSVIQDDVRHVHVRVTAALAVAAVFVTQLEFERLRALSLTFRVLLVAGLTLLVLAAFSYFRYTQLLHWMRLRIVNSLAETGAGPAALAQVTADWRRDFLARGITPPKAWYYGGQTLFATGAAALGAVVARLFLP